MFWKIIDVYFEKRGPCNFKIGCVSVNQCALRGAEKLFENGYSQMEI